ncbi:D-alanyl-D-alanine carboxypeptidase [Bathymodiolus thermophilus thioautotrophic gill symbiont]|uniref:serine-type D-Ala-D-Ala carboxypeptidase n=1 Tax=Bathymodiolus thermophilus thioautotrophic gill symbiont TaxID=2360 RepID=A0A3G3IL43_9GAMM|nr:D-alanyl-D-alanine carboxypeptidase family protein [Bathymodiolus thermophilus thioautotrophic gill symbiont]AYQ56570.1 D-alanyl-D-alanine carboxypeptidase [Bathymodiolus thermophilus thioautotrophic gill symbiont]
MKKKSLPLFTFIAFATLSINTQAAIFITPKAPSINAAAYIVLDHNSGVVIAANKPDKKRSPASLTKLMTAYVVFQLIKDGRVSLNDEVRISKKAWKTGGSKSFVEVGKTIPLETLLKGMIIQSGNDSAVALAEHIAGTEGTFATYMNEYAKELGMTNSRFENASGLPHKNQHTTARDITILASATIRDFPQFYEWYSQKEFTYHGIKQPNRNKLLWSDHTVDGLKTGHTKKAGYNLVASAKRVGMRLISAVLGSTSTQARAAQTQTILDYGFRFFETQEINKIDQKIAISGSTKTEIKVGFEAPQTITLSRGQYKLTQQVIELDADLTAPINAGDNIGHLIIKFEGKNIAELPVIALENAPKAGFFSRMLDKIKF